MRMLVPDLLWVIQKEPSVIYPISLSLAFWGCEWRII